MGRVRESWPTTLKGQYEEIVMAWRMQKACENCPFNKSGKGLHLRRSLARGRWREILFSLRTGEYFICHKTGDETGDGSNLVCSGSLDWQEKAGVSSNFQRVMERLDYFRNKSA